MSLQTNEQAQGYILLAGFGAGIKADDLADMRRLAIRSFDSLRADTETGEIGNSEVCDLLMQIAQLLNFDQDMIEKLRSELFYSFDMKTVEEAGKISGFFRKLGV